MRGVYCVVTGVYTTEAEIEMVFFNLLTSQVMDRLHKKHMLTEIAFILECIDIYIFIQMTSKVIGPYMFSNFSNSDDRG